jgi:hypothetical protein
VPHQLADYSGILRVLLRQLRQVDYLEVQLPRLHRSLDLKQVQTNHHHLGLLRKEAREVKLGQVPHLLLPSLEQVSNSSSHVPSQTSVHPMPHLIPQHQRVRFLEGQVRQLSVVHQDCRAVRVALPYLVNRLPTSQLAKVHYLEGPLLLKHNQGLEVAYLEEQLVRLNKVLFLEVVNKHRNQLEDFSVRLKI